MCVCGCGCLTPYQQLKSYETWPRLKVSSDNLKKPEHFLLSVWTLFEEQTNGTNFELWCDSMDTLLRNMAENFVSMVMYLQEI